MTVPRHMLGRTGLSLPVIGFGCGPTADLIAAGHGDAQRAAVMRALEHGIDFFDTAPLYGGGESERTLGKIFRELAVEPLVATKVLLSDDDLQDIGAAIERSLEASCERLGRSEVTVLMLHNRIGNRRAPKRTTSPGPVLSVVDMLGAAGVAEAFTRLRDNGKVQWFGCTAYGGEMTAVAEVLDSGLFDCLSVHYSLLNTSAWTAGQMPAGQSDYSGIGARAAVAGIGIIALRVLEAGRLAGNEQARSSTTANDAIEMRIRQLAKELEPKGTLTEAALRFTLSRPEVTSSLVGFSNVEQVDAAAASIAKGALPGALISRIAAWQTGTHERILT